VDAELEAVIEKLGISKLLREAIERKLEKQKRN
jgi:hypothetical protein